MFKELDQKKTVDAREKDILAFWESERIFEKSVENRPEDQRYTFYDGPPFATGLPHYGHIVATALKDVVPRYWTMRGKRVERVWGWDCHGLPIENIVEKELGSKSKRDIMEMGVAAFNEKCRERVLEFASEWEKIIPRLGRWVDMKNAYRTMDRDFMESVWWVFKTIYDKGLVYKDYRSMHICPRCETTLSQSEVTEGYAMIKDLSVTAKFELVDESDTYVLAWTTTPWTLPGNVALAVGEDISYVKVTHDESQYIVAKNLVENVFADKEYAVVAEMTGAELVGKSYKPLWDYFSSDESLENRENGWKIYAADFIEDTEGTGIAHEAPAYGAEDMALGKKHALPWVQHVRMDGTFIDAVKDFAGLNVKPVGDHTTTDIEIIKNLAHKNLLFSKQKYEHSYPHCWRCDTPLLNYATSSWFVAVEEMKDDLLNNAKEINWSPAHMKAGRFGKWLEGARDWSISRQRFWASAIPIWECENSNCSTRKVFGDVAELENLSGQKISDLHKHIVDAVVFPCQACAGEMRRVPDVLDTWFDSGSMPYAQMHYPFENKETFEAGFPADFIAEGVDQTRAWFYYLHVLSGGVMGSHAFNNVTVNGIVVAEDGKKMSKKLKNYPDPMEIVDKYGADALRFYLMSSPVVAADNLAFNEKDLQEVSRGAFRMLRQSYSFFLMYASVDAWQPGTHPQSSENILDQWILARLQETINDVNANMEAYELHKAARVMVPFIDDLSNWYIRRSRKRFWKSEDDTDKDFAYATLHHVLVETAKMMAPFTPFQSEEMYKGLTDGESVHLEDFPERATFDGEARERMQVVRDVISAGLDQRAEKGVKVRQPLASATVKIDNLSDEYADILADELNVKEVRIAKGNDVSITLDFGLTEELLREGKAREVIRVIQAGRKKAGFNVDDRIMLGYKGLEDVFAVHADLIAHEVLAEDIFSHAIDDPDFSEVASIDDEEITFYLTKKN